MHEFYVDKYYELQNYEAKFSNYFDHFKIEDGSSMLRSYDIKNRINQSLRAKKDFFVFKNINNLSYLVGEDNSFKNFQKFISFFTPKITDPNKKISILSIRDNTHLEQFEYEGNEILLDFCRFIINNREAILRDSEVSENQYPSANYKLVDLFKMIEIIL